MNVAGATSLTADNGLTGTSAVNYGITLANASNSFGGTVSSVGSNISLADGNTGGLILGNTTATTLTATTYAAFAPISQAGSTVVNVTGTTSLQAVYEYYDCTTFGGCSGPFYEYGTITLANAKNIFGGAVYSDGGSISLLSSGPGGLTLGNTTAIGSLTLTSLAGPITQYSYYYGCSPYCYYYYTTVYVTGSTAATADNGKTGVGDVNTTSRSMLWTTETTLGDPFLQRLNHRSRGEWLDRPYAG